MTATTPTPTPVHVALVNDFAGEVCYQVLYPPSIDAAPRNFTARQALLDALAQPALAAPVLPHCWMVSGSSRAHFGEYAEHDATEEARQCGGGARAYPLHMPQQPTPAASPAMRTVSEGEALQGSRWVSSDDVQRMTQQIHRAMYPDVAPPVNCLLCDIVAEVCARLESEASPKPCFMCHGAGWHWMPCAVPAGVEPPKPQKMTCTQCRAPSVEVASPVAPTREQTHFTRDDELSLLLDITREMALGDKSLHAATQWVEALGGVQDRLAALSAAPVLSDDQKRELITNFFEETRDVSAAMNLLHDYHRLIAQPTATAANPEQGAHVWIRHALGVPETAPYRFDFYAQEIEALKLAQVMQPVATTVDYLRELLAEAIATIDSLPGYPKGADLCDRIEAALEPIVEVAAPVAKADPDAARFVYLMSDLAGSNRVVRNALLDRLAVMSYSAGCAAIDAAMKGTP